MSRIKELAGMLEKAWRDESGMTLESARIKALVSVCDTAFSSFDKMNGTPAYGGGMSKDWEMTFREIRVRAQIGVGGNLSPDQCRALASMLRETIGLSPLTVTPEIEDEPDEKEPEEDFEAGMAGPE